MHGCKKSSVMSLLSGWFSQSIALLVVCVVNGCLVVVCARPGLIKVHWLGALSGSPSGQSGTFQVLPFTWAELPLDTRVHGLCASTALRWWWWHVLVVVVKCACAHVSSACLVGTSALFNYQELKGRKLKGWRLKAENCNHWLKGWILGGRNKWLADMNCERQGCYNDCIGYWQLELTYQESNRWWVGDWMS